MREEKKTMEDGNGLGNRKTKSLFTKDDESSEEENEEEFVCDCTNVPLFMERMIAKGTFPLLLGWEHGMHGLQHEVGIEEQQAMPDKFNLPQSSTGWKEAPAHEHNDASNC